MEETYVFDENDTWVKSPQEPNLHPLLWKKKQPPSAEMSPKEL